MNWLPGWNSITDTEWWSNFYFWASIVSLFFLGFFEVVSHRYTARKDELASHEQIERQQLHDNEIAQLNLKASNAEKQAAEETKEALKLRLELEKLREQSKKIDNRIVNFVADITINFTWPQGVNPLLDNENDGSDGALDLFWINTPGGLIKMITTSGYRINRTGTNSAQFTARFSPKVGEYPLGKQIDTISTAKDFIVFVVLKGYWTNGRDNYQVTITNSYIDFSINNLSGKFQNNTLQILTPTKAEDSIFGVTKVHYRIESGLGSLFIK